MKNLDLNVIGMECAGCENRIKNAISEFKKVKKVDANHETGKVNILLKNELTDELKENIIQAIESMDFKVEK